MAVGVNVAVAAGPSVGMGVDGEGANVSVEVGVLDGVGDGKAGVGKASWVDGVEVGRGGVGERVDIGQGVGVDGIACGGSAAIGVAVEA